MTFTKKNKMDYEFEENPPWRKGELPTTTEMVREITQWRKRFANPSKLVQRIIDYHAENAAVDYVHNMSRGEIVGTQTREDTQEVVEKVLKSEPNEREEEGKEFTETVNNYKAMKHIYKLYKEEKGLITIEQVNDTHKILMNGIHKDHGKIRDGDVSCTWDGEDYTYTLHEFVDSLLHVLIVHHTECIEHLRQLDVESEEYTAGVFRCAARLMFEFVHLHPYAGGNGRMCRLLANYVLQLITPFPVAIYHSDESRSTRDDYVKAIVRCRDNPEEGPRALAAMLVDGAWYGWKKLIAFEEKRSEVSMVIKKSLFQEQREKYISHELRHIWKVLEMKGNTMSEEEVMEKVVEVVSGVDTTLLARPFYMETEVQLKNDIHFFLNVYN